MSMPADQMELREEEIRAHYAAAAAMLEGGVDHTPPRIAKPKVEVNAPERSPPGGIGTRRRFRSTTPGGLVTRSTARPEGVRLVDRIEGGADEGDPLVSPVQATVLHTLRRAISIALAMGGEGYAEQTGWWR